MPRGARTGRGPEAVRGSVSGCMRLMVGKAAAQRVHASLTDVRFEIEDVVAEDDRVAVRLTASATAIGDFMGLPAAGKRYRIGEMHFFRIRDGKVVEHWHQYDAAGMMKQLGAAPG